MSIFEFFKDWIGVPSGFDFLIVSTAAAAALIVLDNITKSLFGVISSLFKKGSRS